MRLALVTTLCVALGLHVSLAIAGEEVTMLTSDPARESNPVVSPDGSHIAFKSYQEQSPELRILRLRDGNQETVGQFGEFDERVAWSPDGRSIFVVVRTEDGAAFTMVDARNGTQTTIVDNQLDITLPALSPDGKYLAYSQKSASDDRDNSTHPNLHVFEIGSGKVTEIVPSLYRDLWPSWHPNGTRLVFFSRRDTAGENDELYALELGGGTLTRLTHADGNDFAPTYSPDGSRIAFSSNREGNPSIYVMKADGSCQTQITSDQTRDSHPAWSPDRTRIYFSTREPDANYDIAWVDAPKKLLCN